MKKGSKNKILLFITLILQLLILITAGNVYATEIENCPEEYKEWLNLSEKEKAQIPVKPRSFRVEYQGKAQTQDDIINSSLSTQILPTRYDLREYNGVKGVKNQKSWEYCWAFASTSALESHLLNKTRIDAYSNCTSLTYNLNPMHIGSSLAYGFSYFIEGNIYGKQSLNSGGNNIDSVLYWASGLGPVNTNTYISKH